MLISFLEIYKLNFLWKIQKLDESKRQSNLPHEENIYREDKVYFI